MYEEIVNSIHIEELHLNEESILEQQLYNNNNNK